MDLFIRNYISLTKKLYLKLLSKSLNGQILFVVILSLNTIIKNHVRIHLRF